MKYIFSFIFLLVTTIAFAVSDIAVTQPPGALGIANVPSIVPLPPSYPIAGYILIDAYSGNVLVEKNADAHLPPASLTKIMTLYLIADALKSGKIHFIDQVTISENAWRKGGSRMFIKVGSMVPIQALVAGIVTASGNDATVAMAEYLAGSEEVFVNLMNQTAATLGMKDTHYVDSNGLPEPTHYSSARDIANLARAWIFNFPEYYPWFKEKWFEYNGIKQPNRNRLLWHDASVDGMKTGHTDEAGYCLVASAVRNNMRLIAVVMGAASDKARTIDAEGLLNYGFRFFETHKLYDAHRTLITPRVWFGQNKYLALGLKDDFYVTTPIGQYKNLKVTAQVDHDLRAPIKEGAKCGELNVILNGKLLAAEPLIALHDDLRSGFFGVTWDRVLRIFGKNK